MSVQLMSVQLIEFQLMSVQLIDAQDWSLQLWSLQDWLVHDIEFQDMLVFAALAQLCASNTCPEPPGAGRRYCSRPRFGFGAYVLAAARLAVTSPRPAAFGLPSRTVR